VLGCAFCGKTTDEVEGRIVAICEECVRLCVEIFEE
jgi:ATP-dependent protease Clp ATPase subunit